MKKHNSREAGQVLVIVALGFVVFLGFVALALDAGILYSDRRHQQNASDAASLAGAGAAALSLENSLVTYGNWSCSDSRVVTAQAEAVAAAIARAATNGYTVDGNISDVNGVTTSCHVVNNGAYIDKYIDITTQISATSHTSFVQVFFNGNLINTVEAVTRVRPRAPYAFGNAIVATRTDCPNSNTGGVHFDGNNDVIVTGGGIFSNACMTAGGSVSVDVTGGTGIACVGEGCYDENGNPVIDPDPHATDITLPPSSLEVPPPNCDGQPDRGSITSSGTYQPGVYSQIRVSNSDTVVLQPGLYCVGDFNKTGGTLTGVDVTIYVTSGDFDINGGSTVIDAPPARNCPMCPPALPGVLIYIAPGHGGEVALLGNGSSDYLGLVYAPDGMIEVGGTAGESSLVHAQLIGETVKIHGNAELVVNFDDQVNPQRPAALELYK